MLLKINLNFLTKVDLYILIIGAGLVLYVVQVQTTLLPSFGALAGLCTVGVYLPLLQLPLWGCAALDSNLIRNCFLPTEITAKEPYTLCFAL